MIYIICLILSICNVFFCSIVNDYDNNALPSLFQNASSTVSKASAEVLSPSGASTITPAKVMKPLK